MQMLTWSADLFSSIIWQKSLNAYACATVWSLYEANLQITPYLLKHIVSPVNHEVFWSFDTYKVQLNDSTSNPCMEGTRAS